VLGGVIYPIVVHKLLPELGFSWAARVLGFVALGTCAISIAVLRIRVKAPKKRILFDWNALRETPFALLTAAFFFALMGLYVPAFYIQAYAVDKNVITGELSAYILPILNAGGVVGRVLPNFFADRTGPFNILTPSLVFAGMVTLVWIAATNTGGLIIVALIYGFFSGAILSLPPIAIVSLCPSLAVIGTRFGTVCAIGSLGLLVGTPVSGAILGWSRNYVGLQVFGGILLIAAGVTCGAARVSKAGYGLAVKA
jgi:predicted MFS family arabinose efflux permease